MSYFRWFLYKKNKQLNIYIQILKNKNKHIIQIYAFRSIQTSIKFKLSQISDQKKKKKEQTLHKPTLQTNLNN